MSSFVPYVVSEGDHLPKIAAMRGFNAEEVWAHSDNEKLRTARKDMCILSPGDVVYIPQDTRKFLPVTIGAQNRFTATPRTVPVNVGFSSAGKALANERCIVHGMRGPNEFTTDDEGMLSFRVGAMTSQVRVEFPKRGLSYDLKIGHLDPIATLAGVFQRLQNLGFIPRTDAMPDEMAAADLSYAVSDFQSAQGLKVTGELDQATRDKLESVYNG